jgi:Uma2 family endonuclease
MTAVQARLKFGPSDHGRAVTEEELSIAEYKSGYKYEVIDGELAVSPVPNLPEAFLDDWLYGKLYDYSRAHPDVVNFLNDKARVHIPGRDNLTVPEPDIAVYKDFPRGKLIRDLNWSDINPLVVIEVLVDSDPDKDLVRNVGLYRQVPSIAEYWILDGRDNCDEPLLIARRRYGSRWLIQEVPYGETYRTPTLPGFELLVDPLR